MLCYADLQRVCTVAIPPIRRSLSLNILSLLLV